jgi:hypothetical protein
MIALLVSSLLVGMILAIYSRMSLAYRGQQQIAGVQQILAAARAAIELDAKQAGLGMPQGFKTAITGRPAVESPVQVTDSSTGPDQIAFFYADTSTQALVNDASTLSTSATITVADPPVGFLVGMLVVLTTSSTAANPLSTVTNPLPDIATYDACVLRIASIDTAGQRFTFDTAQPWGTAPGPTHSHCPNVVMNRTMMYRFVAHAYRVALVPPPLQIGTLQRSVTGNLTSTEVWNDLAYGFSDLQTAVWIYDASSTAVDLDGDGDASRNWYSGATQTTVASLPPPTAGSALLGMSISLVAHTDRSVEGIATAATPDLIGPPAPAAPNPDNNSLGDRPSVVLPTAQPWPDPLLPGLRIYRWTTFQVDFRNLGVGVGVGL